ncbi:amidase [Hoyosella rhizosphaerae]|nr:amidase [Hoyosella rhizosphaerae]
MPTLTDLAGDLAAGRVTSVALTTAVLDRVDATQPTLNAFRTVLRDAALRDATEADRRLSAGHRSPLLGVPVAVKDDVDVAGAPSSLGARGQFPHKSVDSEVVRRLRAAGAVIVGKTNGPEFFQWPVTSGPGFGVTRNPWSPDHTPGGSSGGAAAAVAAGIVPAALGSDGAGSIRIPAAWTNLVGIKPQRGRISIWPERELFYGLTVIGPLARTVADAALLLDIAAGSHLDDRDQPPAIEVSNAVGRDPGKLRVVVAENPPFVGSWPSIHPAVHDGLENVAQTIREIGHQTSNLHLHYGIPVGLSFLPRSLAGLDDLRNRVPDPSLLDPRTAANARVGRLLKYGPLHAARAMEPLLRRQFARVFRTADVILAPTTATPPLLTDALDGASATRTNDIITGACPYTYPWNVLGWPSVAIPAGITQDGLPVGVQLMGPENSEPLLVSLAAQLEERLRWHENAPLPW